MVEFEMAGKNCLLLVMVCSVFLPLPASAEAAISSNTSVNLFAHVQISNFSVTPFLTSQNQFIDFSVTVENTGNLAVNVTPVINIRDSANNTVSNITFAPVSILVENNATLIASWNTDTYPLEEYKAVAAVNYDNKSTPNVERTFKIQSVALQPSSGSSSSERWLGNARIEIIKYPTVKEMRPGDIATLDILVSNTGQIRIAKLEVDIYGIPRDWIGLKTREMELGIGSIKGINMALSIPQDAKPGNYRVTAVLKNGMYETRTFFILTIKPSPVEVKRPTVTREVVVDAQKSMSTITINVKNTNKFVSRLEVVEEIPKDIASRVDQITSGSPEWEVIESDPIIKWSLENIDFDEMRSITYTIPKVLEVIYLNWPIKQINIFYDINQQVVDIEISEIETAMLTPGKKGRLSMTVSNHGKAPLNVTFDMKLPAGWKVEPESVALQFAPSADKVVDFVLSSPEGATSGVYTIPIKMSYDGKSLTKDISIYIKDSPTEKFHVVFVLGGITIIAIILILTLKKLIKIKE